MKILHILPGFELGYPGGITLYVKNLALQQVAKGETVSVLCSPPEEYAFPEEIKCLSYKIPRREVFSFSLIDNRSIDADCIGEILNDGYDVIHVHTILGLSFGFLNSVMNMGIPYFFSVHDYYSFCPRVFMLDRSGDVCRKFEIERCAACVGLLDQFNFVRIFSARSGLHFPFRSNLVQNRVRKLSAFFRKASRIVAVSKRVEQLFLEAYPECNTVVINIGNASAEWDVPIKSVSDKIRAVFLGTLNRHKGADLFARFINECGRNDVEFHFYGRASKDSQSVLKLPGVVDHGSYSPENLPEILSNSDFGMILPIWEDNGPQVVMEILNSGTPILATKVGGIPDFVKEECGFLFDPDSEVGFQSALSWIRSISKKDIIRMGHGIGKTKNLSQHAQDIRLLYEGAW